MYADFGACGLNICGVIGRSAQQNNIRTKPAKTPHITLYIAHKPAVLYRQIRCAKRPRAAETQYSLRMHMPPRFNAKDQACARAPIRENPFAGLIATDDEALPYVTHLPLRLGMLPEAGHAASVAP